MKNNFAKPEIAAGHLVGIVYSIATNADPQVSLATLRVRLSQSGAKPQHFQAGINFAVASGWLTIEGASVELTPAGRAIFA